MECNPSGCGKEHCGACCGGMCQKGSLILTKEEEYLLRKFAELAFLPVACTDDNTAPIFLTNEYNISAISSAINSLWQKGLIEVDYDIPLLNYSYDGYEPYPVHGSMALTSAGQDAADNLDV